MPTPHIAAGAGDIAPLVLMPGDPRRARRIAESMLDEARLVTDVRGIEGYTGTVGGERVTVLASGMGSPSVTIYATELYQRYDVQRIVRVGTAGGLEQSLTVGDLVAAIAAHTDSAMSVSRIPTISLSHVASFTLLRAAADAAARDGTKLHVGTVFTTDHFYLERPGVRAALMAHRTLAVEMETAALYDAAAAEGREALALLTISDLIGRPDAMTAQERERCFAPMSTLAIAALFA